MTNVFKQVLVILILTCCGAAAIAAGPPATVTVTATPDRIPANGNAFLALAAEIKDSSGNPVDNGTSVSWTCQTLGVLTATTTTTTSGVATNTLRAPVVTGTSTVTATAGSVNGTVQVTYSGPAASGGIDAGACLRADGSSTMRLVATFVDGDDHPVGDGTAVSFSTTSGSITQNSITRNGEAVAVLTAGSQTGTATITATCGSVSATSDVEMAGTPAQLLVISAVESLRADGTSQCGVRAVLQDADDRPVGGGFQISFSTNYGSVTSSALTVDGQATVTLTAASSPCKATVTATYSGLSETVDVIMAGDPSAIAVSQDDLSIAADGTSATFVRAEITDAAGNAVADGTVVAFSTTAGTVTAQSPTLGGMAKAQLTSASSPGSATITATCGSLSNDAVVVLAGSPATVELESVVNSIPADGSATCVVRGTVSDSAGNAAADATEVTFSTTSGTVSPRAFTVGGSFFSVLKSSATAGTADVTATCGSASDTTDVVFGGSVSAIQVVVSPSVLPADGNATGVVEASLTDSGSRAVADGTVVSFSTTLGTIVSSATTFDGKAYAKLTSSSSAGSGTVTASIGGVQGTAGFSCQ